MNFEFSGHAVDVEIGGKTYSVDCSTTVQLFILKQNKELNHLIGQLKRGEKTEQDAIDLMKQTFDKIFGDGVIDEIFTDRPMTVDDLADLSLFIRDVYARYNSDFQRRAAGQAAKQKT